MHLQCLIFFVIGSLSAANSSKSNEKISNLESTPKNVPRSHLAIPPKDSANVATQHQSTDSFATNVIGLGYEIYNMINTVESKKKENSSMKDKLKVNPITTEENKKHIVYIVVTVVVCVVLIGVIGGFKVVRMVRKLRGNFGNRSRTNVHNEDEIRRQQSAHTLENLQKKNKVTA